MKRQAGLTGCTSVTGTTMIAFQVFAAAAVMASLCIMVFNDVRRHG